MPTSVTGNKRSVAGDVGFTLVELMIVVAIIGIASGAVVLGMPSQQGSLRGEAERFAARAIAARNDAILGSRDMSIWVTADGSGVSRRSHGVWQSVELRTFAPRRWDPGTTALVTKNGTQRVIFDTTGSVPTPVVFKLVRSGGSERASVIVAGSGAVRVEQ